MSVLIAPDEAEEMLTDLGAETVEYASVSTSGEVIALKASNEMQVFLESHVAADSAIFHISSGAIDDLLSGNKPAVGDTITEIDGTHWHVRSVSKINSASFYRFVVESDVRLVPGKTVGAWS